MKILMSYSSNIITRNLLKLKDKDKYGKIDYILMFNEIKEKKDDTNNKYYILGIYKQEFGGYFTEEEKEKVIEYIKKKENYQIMNLDKLKEDDTTEAKD